MPRKKEGKTVEEKIEGIFAFYQPEEQDLIVKASLDRMAARKGHAVQYRWSEEGLMVRRQVIIDLLGQGLCHFRIQQELMARWHISQTAAFTYIKDAINFMAECNKDFYKNKADLMITRLEAIAEDALAHGDRKSALSAYDQINKITGQYITKVDADVNGSMDITFDFS